MKSRNLLPRVYELKTYPGRKSPYVVRWVVNGEIRGRSFANKTQADNFRAALIHAINSRERFSNITGLPQSMETTGVSVASLVKGFVDSKKHVWEARTRESALVPLAEMLICLVTKNAPAPTRTTKKEISMWLMGDDIEDPLYIKYSLNISECSPAVCADAFDELCYCLEEDGVTRSTKFKASATIIRYRRACAQFFIYVVERELLTNNPWPAGKRGKTTRKERGKGDLRIDLLPTHAQAVETINAIASHQPRSQAYKVVCSLMYYAGLRPGEARALRIENCGTLTAGQWGQATIDEAAKDAAPGYYLSKSELLGDPKTDARVVSLHPVLVGIILQPSEKWSKHSEQNIADACKNRDVAVAVLDSTGEALSVDGVQPNALVGTKHSVDVRHCRRTRCRTGCSRQRAQHDQRRCIPRERTQQRKHTRK
jgi:hypothetical protein